MKTISLFIFLIILVNLSFSQKGSLRNLNNDKIINYILAGKYQRVIELTELPSFDQVMLFDTNWTHCKFYSRSNNYLDSLSDSLFISYMIRIKNVINVSNINELFNTPTGIQFEISNYLFDDSYLEGTCLPVTQYYRKCYQITDEFNKYVLIISFINSKINGISIQIFSI